MTAAVPGPREDIDWSAHRGSCRVFYAERRCTCGAVPDPSFRDQLAEAAYMPLRWAICDRGIAAPDIAALDADVSYVAGSLADALMPTIAAEVEARVQAAAEQWEVEDAADTVLALADDMLARWPGAYENPDLDEVYDWLVAQAAALAAPPPTLHTADEEADRG